MPGKKKPVKKMRKLMTLEDSIVVKQQPLNPCKDCPWARLSLPGWTGGATCAEWLCEVHGDHPMDCHTQKLGGKQAQCAGAAIFRANVCKSAKFRLPADRKSVFASDMEFASHHLQRTVTMEEILDMKMKQFEKIIHGPSHEAD